jgi:hypothetical protein
VEERERHDADVVEPTEHRHERLGHEVDRGGDVDDGEEEERLAEEGGVLVPEVAPDRSETTETLLGFRHRRPPNEDEGKSRATARNASRSTRRRGATRRLKT